MYISVKLKQFFKDLGLTIDRYPAGDLRRRMLLFEHFNIQTIYDVGANKGQYARLMRKLGYKGKIISYEPLEGPYKKLHKSSEPDVNWQTFQLGIGDEFGEKEINVSENLVSSSFQEMLPIHISESPDSKYIRTEKVELKTFDSEFVLHHNTGEVALLKIDTQGYELNVLRGASKSLEYVTAVQIEMCLSQTYENEPDYLSIIQILKESGFKLFSLETGYSNKKSGQLYQADGIFFKEYLDQK